MSHSTTGTGPLAAKRAAAMGAGLAPWRCAWRASARAGFGAAVLWLLTMGGLVTGAHEAGAQVAEGQVAEGQSAEEQVPGEQGPATFDDVIDVQVINVEVVVTDADGQPVPDLGPDAFRLTVDGTPVTIDYFSEVRSGVARSADVSAASSGGAAPPAPSVAPGDPVGTSYLLFVDQFFGVQRDLTRVLNRMRDDLAGFRPGDRLAIVAYDGRRLEQVAAWASGRDAIERGFNKATALPAFGLQRLGERNLLDRQRRGSATSVIQGSGTAVLRDYLSRLNSQVDRVLRAATTAMRTNAQAPGRKVLLLTSGGWPTAPAVYATGSEQNRILGVDAYTSTDAFNDLTGTANLLGYTIFPIDLPGRMAQGNVRVDESLGVGGERAINNGEQRLGNRSLSVFREHAAESTLIELAEATGGVPLINGERDTALADVQADLASYYWLGFAPDRRRDDVNHAIEIVMTRPGLEARSRSSFRDLSRRSEVTMRVESHLLFESPLDAVPLEVTFGSPGRAPGAGVLLPVIVKIPLDHVTMLPTARGFSAELALRVAIVDEQGDRNTIPVIPIQFSGAQKPAPGQHFTYETTLNVRKDKQRLVLAVHDLVGDEVMAATVEAHPKKMR